MIRWLMNLLHRPAYRAGGSLHRSGRGSRNVNGQFVSFLQDTGFRRSNPDRYERGLRNRKFALAAIMWASVAGFAWVVVESAQALSLF